MSKIKTDTIKKPDIDTNFAYIVKTMLISEILSFVKNLGALEFSTPYGDGVWALNITHDKITLFGYAAENMTHELDAMGFTPIYREEYDIESAFNDPKSILETFTITQLSAIYEQTLNKHLN